jgi:hypothetical protein
MADFDNINQIQRNMALRLSSEAKMDNTLSLLMIIQGLVPDKFGRVQRELVVLEATQQGLNENEVDHLIDELLRNRTLKEEGDYLFL